MQILVVAIELVILTLGNISLDGTKIHADASKSKAISYNRLLALEKQLQAEGEEMFALAKKAEQKTIPTGMVIEDEVALRQERLMQMGKAVLEVRARYEEEKAAQTEAERSQRAGQRT